MRGFWTAYLGNFVGRGSTKETMETMGLIGLPSLWILILKILLWLCGNALQKSRLVIANTYRKNFLSVAIIWVMRTHHLLYQTYLVILKANFEEIIQVKKAGITASWNLYSALLSNLWIPKSPSYSNRRCVYIYTFISLYFSCPHKPQSHNATRESMPSQ